MNSGMSSYVPGSALRLLIAEYQDAQEDFLYAKERLDARIGKALSELGDRATISEMAKATKESEVWIQVMLRHALGAKESPPCDVEMDVRETLDVLIKQDLA